MIHLWLSAFAYSQRRGVLFGRKGSHLISLCDNCATIRSFRGLGAISKEQGGDT